MRLTARFDRMGVAALAALLAVVPLAPVVAAPDAAASGRSRSLPADALPTVPAGASLYGLVIGINEYDAPIPSLDGAVNDAEDVANMLRSHQARRVWLLKNREATRDRIFAAWKELRATAKPGDYVVVHIAGHGARSPEKIPGTGTDGLDEFFVLSSFRPDGPNTRERIINKEWGAMLREGADLKILFVADTCHSGSMTRGYSPRKLKTRVLSPTKVVIRNDALPAPDPATWVVTPEQLSHVVFFGAVGQDELDPEVLIDGQSRGALSWAVANGLRGAADLDRNAELTKEELSRYILDVVVAQTEGEQHPRLMPGQVPLDLRAAASASAAATTVLPPPPPPFSLEVLNATQVPATDLAKGLRHVVMASAGAATDLTWDVAQGKLRNQFQDTLIFPEGPGMPPPSAAEEATRDYRRAPAQSRDGKADLPRIQAAIDKRAVAQWLTTMAASQPLSVALSPKDTVQHKGDQAVLSVRDFTTPYLTVVNLGPSGNVNLIYPIAGDPLEVAKGTPYTLDLTAEPPYGAEHFVAFASDKPLTAFHKGLAVIDGKPQLEEFKRLVTEAARTARLQVGIHSVFTAP